MTFVRSYSVAIFVVGRGIEPVSIENDGATTVFAFPDDAKDVLQAYRAAKRRLEQLVDAQAVQA